MLGVRWYCHVPEGKICVLATQKDETFTDNWIPYPRSMSEAIN